MPKPAHGQQALLSLVWLAPEATQAVLNRFAHELNGRVGCHRQFVSPQHGPRVTTLPQVAKKTNGHVGGNEADVLPGAGSPKVRDFHRRVVDDDITLADASRQLQVLPTEGKGAVPAAALLIDAAWHEHGSAHEDFHGPGRDWIEIQPAITTVSTAHEAGPAQYDGAVQQSADGGTAAVGNLNFALAVAQSWPKDANFRMGIGKAHQPGQRAGWKNGIVVEKK